MTDAPRATRGRPRVGSPSLLEEAAFELFLENGYAGTTVEQISTRAGVSRNTFFNYFAAKSDVFWVGLDASIDRLAASLDASNADGGVLPIELLRTALLDVAARLGPSDVPWVLTHFELIGSTHEVMASAIGRATRLSSVIERALGDATSAAVSRSLSFACVAAVVAAMMSWAEAGPDRGSLASHLERALSPVLTGFSSP
ncbi:TetR family transcriptional regulator [Agreia pratensis]|uniref:Transcriptional regulator, TetR family n=1 Tax=Agreia pratensis TaxID=150121 RepID=A0A1X7L153_9MICO|nr:TetR/AcrR family transcriptional regulator [Agreia pratensis]MBF4633702.1 TetR family transcriptional regulator [Agreia pratensis]SMG47347.1 transcriptional regulator, TetR family [Agreia pratensis]